MIQISVPIIYLTRFCVTGTRGHFYSVTKYPFQANCIRIALPQRNWCEVPITRWGRVTHICVSKLTTIGSDNGLSPGRRPAIIWPNAGILFTGTLGTNFNKILIEIYIFSFKKMHFKLSSGNWWPFCLGLIALTILVVLKPKYRWIIGPIP